MTHILLPVLLSAVLARGISIPPPNGPYDVAIKIQTVTDPDRPADPIIASQQRNACVQPDSAKGRRILISVFVPVETAPAARGDGPSPCPRMTIPYMTPMVAADYGEQAAGAGLPRELYSLFSMDFCRVAGWHPGTRPSRKFPVALFTPGLRESRLLYGAGARSLASRGHVVVTVDHPFEASFVEFPDGTVIQGRDISSDEAAVKELLVQVRTADLSFVVDQLHNRTLTDSLLGPLSGSLDLSKLVVYGHSLGGAAAASLTRTDKRIRGGIDLDGQLVDPALSLGLDKPFLLAGRSNHGAQDATWDNFWPNLRGPRLEMGINGTAHASFTDRPMLVSALRQSGWTLGSLDSLESLIGSVEGRRLEKIVDDVLAGFFDYTFCKDDGRIRSLKEKYAEVFIQRSDL